VEKRELSDADHNVVDNVVDAEKKGDTSGRVGSFTQKERRLYALIWKTAMQSCMTDAVYMQIVSTLKAPQDTQYTYTCETVDFPGWKKLEHEPASQSKNLYSYLRTLKNGTIIPYKQISTDFSLIDRKLHYTEAKWVNLLEEKGIGRPSTYSSLIEKVQERKYVSKKDVPGSLVECVDFVLEAGPGLDIVEINKKKVLGAEKNKIVMEPLGTTVIQFLMKHFPSFFQYTYTKYMEDTLDSIAHGSATQYDLCHQCNTELSSLIDAVKTEHANIQIDADHAYKVGKYGPYIETTGGRSLSLRKGINLDMEKLRTGGYRVEELVERRGKPQYSVKNRKEPTIPRTNNFAREKRLQHERGTNSTIRVLCKNLTRFQTRLARSLPTNG
jgi:DNA topoisomerase-1